jgi:hypothetical protein
MGEEQTNELRRRLVFTSIRWAATLRQQPTAEMPSEC